MLNNAHEIYKSVIKWLKSEKNVKTAQLLYQIYLNYQNAKYAVIFKKTSNSAKNVA